MKKSALFQQQRSGGGERETELSDTSKTSEIFSSLHSSSTIQHHATPYIRFDDSSVGTTSKQSLTSTLPTSKVSSTFAEEVKLDVVDLSYNVLIDKKANQTKCLLRNVSFTLIPGNFCALMGPSGAGKSTLLDLLANRTFSGNVSGSILINEQPRSPYYHRISSYVPQDDLHYPFLTVEETILFSAKTRLIEGTSEVEIKQRVEVLLEMMGLTGVRNSYVGNAMRRGISGGQKKRLSIAVEIISLPSLIFLDEPTSGLDSSTALEVITFIKKLTDQRRTCICTIHQPSPEIFLLFDRLVLLCQGRVIYFGKASDAIKYFTCTALGYTFNPIQQSEAEFLLDICDFNTRKRKGKNQSTNYKSVRELEYLYQIFCADPNSALPPRPSEALKSSHADPTLFPLSFSFAASPTTQSQHSQYIRLHATSKLTQLKAIFWRSFTDILRDKDSLKSQFMKTAFVGLLIGIVFYQQADVSEPFYSDGIPNAEVTNVSAILFFTMQYTLLANISIIPLHYFRNAVYRRESLAYAYTTSMYWLVQITANLPVILINQLLFTLFILFLCGFNSSFGYFGYLYLSLFLLNLCSYYLGMVLICYTMNMMVSFAVFPLIFIFLSTCSGFSINIESIPPFWSWGPYVAFTRWAFEGMMVNEWSQYNTDDDAEYTSGNGDVLAYYNFTGYNKWNSIGILLLYIAVMIGIVYYLMRHKPCELIVVDDASDRNEEENEDGGSNLEKDSGVNDIESAYIPPPLSFSVFQKAESTPDAEANQTVESDQNLRKKGLYFCDLSYTISNKDKSKTTRILHKVSGYVLPGQLCAVMGSSGGGKSTLMDVLANRKTQGEVSGQLCYGGLALNSNNSILRNSSSYVMQTDLHLEELTVRETVEYAAELRLSESMSENEKKDRVTKVLEILGLIECMDCRVGKSGNNAGGRAGNISGGQLRRLTIAVEIIHFPDLIFCDEITTGLDSSLAYEVMCVVKRLSQQNRAILCTIHQPSAQIFHLFNTILLLSEGRLMYFGEGGDIALNYFRQILGMKQVQVNPADFMIHSISQSSNGNNTTKHNMSETYFNSTYYVNSIYPLLSEAISNAKKDEASLTTPLVSDVSGSAYITSTKHQIKILLKRGMDRMRKNPMPTYISWIRHAIGAIYYGTMFYQLGTGDAAANYNNRLALFFFSQSFIILGQQGILTEYHLDRPLFYHERNAKLYGFFSYWIASSLSQIPTIIGNTVLFSILVYTLSGLRSSASSFFIFYYNILLTSLTTLFMCQLVASLSRQVSQAVNVFPMILFFTTSFSGFVIYLPQFPDWLGNWAPYVSFSRYSYQCLVMNEFHSNSNLPDAESYLDNLGFNNNFSISDCMGLSLLFCVGFAVSVNISLKHLNFEKR